MPSDERADDSQIALESRGKGHHALLSEKLCKLILKLQMKFQRSVQKTGAGTAGAVFFKRFDSGLDHLRVRCQSQIVVRSEHNAPFALHDDFHILAALKRMEIRIYPQFLDFLDLRKFVTLVKQIIHIHFTTLSHSFSVIAFPKHTNPFYRKMFQMASQNSIK